MKNGRKRVPDWLATVGAVLALLLVTAGCGVSGSGDKEIDRMDSVAAEIQAALAKRPDVTKVQVKYQNNINAYQQVHAYLTTVGGADVDAILDETTRLIWTSRLSPLSSVTIGITDGADKQPYRDVRLDLKDKKTVDELTAKYGERPVSR